MTDLLARLRELEAAATKGPWRIGRSFKSEGPGGRGNQITPIDAKDPDCERCGHGGGQWLIAWLFKNAVAETLANAALIVAMRNALPDLLARIEAMAGEIEGLREALAMAIPRNVCLTNRNIADSYVVPIEVTMGELRSMAAALTAPSMKENEDGQ